MQNTRKPLINREKEAKKKHLQNIINDCGFILLIKGFLSSEK